MTTNNLLPDRPIPKCLLPIRSIIRRMRYCKHKLMLRNKLVVGENVNFGRYVELRCPNFAKFANNINVGPWFVAETNLDIGSDVLISSKVSFVGNDHEVYDKSKSIYYQGRRPASTVILEGDNLIGFGAIVVGNVKIGKGCIVGAGSVVTKDLPPYSICAGVPARVINYRK